MEKAPAQGMLGHTVEKTHRISVQTWTHWFQGEPAWVALGVSLPLSSSWRSPAYVAVLSLTQVSPEEGRSAREPRTEMLTGLCLTLP